jgi:hypothetical protein
MKYILAILVGFCSICFSQVGIGTLSPHAILDIESSDSGILLPRLSETQKNNIVTPPEALLLYQNDNTKGFYYYDGTSWILINNGVSSSGLSIGQLYMGGIIIHLEPDDKHGLILALGDVPRQPWGSRGNFRSLTNDNIYSGNPNSYSMLRFSPIAREVNNTVSGGYGGWYLPSVNEMMLITGKLALINTSLTNNGGTPMTTIEMYWTSTEVDADDAIMYNSTVDRYISSDKNGSYIARGVRSF